MLKLDSPFLDKEASLRACLTASRHYFKRIDRGELPGSSAVDGLCRIPLTISCLHFTAFIILYSDQIFF